MLFRKNLGRTIPQIDQIGLISTSAFEAEMVSCQAAKHGKLTAVPKRPEAESILTPAAMVPI